MRPESWLSQHGDGPSSRRRSRSCDQALGVSGCGPPAPLDRGPDPFPLRVNGPTWRTGRSGSTALRVCPARSPPHAPSKPEAGPPKSLMCSPRLDHRARVAALGVTPATGPPQLVDMRGLRCICCASQAVTSNVAAAAPWSRAALCASRPTALPPQTPSLGEGVRGGLVGGLQAVGRVTGSLLRLRVQTSIPNPFPLEGAVPTPRPPVGGSEEVRAIGSAFREFDGIHHGEPAGGRSGRHRPSAHQSRSRGPSR